MLHLTMGVPVTTESPKDASVTVSGSQDQARLAMANVDVSKIVESAMKGKRPVLVLARAHSMTSK